jgi:ubiquinol-cytochrome c reductase cytochrome c subunit
MRVRVLLPLAILAFVAAAASAFFFDGGAADAGSLPQATAPPAGTASAARRAPASGGAVAPSVLAEGKRLFIGSCSSCHGLNAEGSSRAPNLVGVGAATVDFWVSTGRMPLAYPTAQAVEKTPSFTPAQSLAIAEYVASLGPGGPPIPTVDLKGANLAEGERLFSTNCAACHTITGVGDALSNGLYAPSLYPATPLEIAEAMRTGPGNMPRFGPKQLTNRQVDDIVAYVRYLRHPLDKGGFGLGHVGPIAEGFVAIVIGMGSLLLIAYWIAGRNTGVGAAHE